MNMSIKVVKYSYTGSSSAFAALSNQLATPLYPPTKFEILIFLVFKMVNISSADGVFWGEYKNQRFHAVVVWYYIEEFIVEVCCFCSLNYRSPCAFYS